MIKKVVTWAILIFIIYWLATDPSGVAATVHSGFGGLRSAATHMSNFVQSL